jgi:hypothetical protein
MHLSSPIYRISVAELLRIALMGAALLAAVKPSDCSVWGLGTAQQPTQNKSTKTLSYETELSAKHLINPNETHRFQVKLQAGQFLLITIKQEEVDITVSLIGKNDESIITMDDNSLLGSHWLVSL